MLYKPPHTDISRDLSKERKKLESNLLSSLDIKDPESGVRVGQQGISCVMKSGMKFSQPMMVW